MTLERFDDIPDVLISQARHFLSDDQMAVIRGAARAQAQTGHRFTPEAIRSFCAEFQIPYDPCLRALGWGPRDQDMISGRVTHKVEDPPATAGTALCALAKR